MSFPLRAWSTGRCSILQSAGTFLSCITTDSSVASALSFFLVFKVQEIVLWASRRTKNIGENRKLIMWPYLVSFFLINWRKLKLKNALDYNLLSDGVAGSCGQLDMILPNLGFFSPFLVPSLGWFCGWLSPLLFVLGVLRVGCLLLLCLVVPPPQKK